jgi:putative thioredoxin
MGQGDYVRARDEFAALLAESPADSLAKIGVAQSGLLSRVDRLDFDAAIAAANQPGATVDQVMAAADVEVASGQVAEGFARLTGAIAQADPDDKETLRLRLLELFDTQEPSDKTVLTARRHLATALF